MQSLDQANTPLPSGTVIFHFNRVPIVAQPVFWAVPFLVTAALAWIAGLRHPARSYSQRLSVGLLALPVALFAEIGHAMAHTHSARMAGAPMDEILLSGEITRTLYRDNAVPPQAHIMRSLGGPIFSLTGFVLSLLWRRLTPRASLNRELADISLVSHSIILLGSVFPLPMVDGGIILKWQLVKAGQTPAQADRVVHKASTGLGILLLALGIFAGAAQKRKLLGGLLAASGTAGIAAGVGWLK